MRKIIMWNMITLDGFFEGPKNWDIDWHNYTWGEELEQLSIEQLKSADLLLFGRVTYETWLLIGLRLRAKLPKMYQIGWLFCVPIMLLACGISLLPGSNKTFPNTLQQVFSVVFKLQPNRMQPMVLNFGILGGGRWTSAKTLAN